MMMGLLFGENVQDSEINEKGGMKWVGRVLLVVVGRGMCDGVLLGRSVPKH